MENRIGVYVCHCGTNIAGKVAVEKVAEYARDLPGVVVSREYRFMCSDPGQKRYWQVVSGYASAPHHGPG
jgi:heterodisulfide reductase subunit A2